MNLISAILPALLGGLLLCLLTLRDTDNTVTFDAVVSNLEEVNVNVAQVIRMPSRPPLPPSLLSTTPSTSPPASFTESFDTDFSVEENWPMSQSGSDDWWVTSGAFFEVASGTAHTFAGSLSTAHPWAVKYEQANARDTASGTRPQNIFRLVLKRTAEDVSQQVYARISYYENSDSIYRNASNGILLFNRFINESTLYYAGVRVDGQVVIKKKYDGTYYTLGVKKIFPGVYNRDSANNLIPLNEWIGIKSEVTTDERGVVHLKLFTDVGRTGIWSLALDIIDDGEKYNSVISDAGHGGIRTDFMDAEFDEYVFAPL